MNDNRYFMAAWITLFIKINAFFIALFGIANTLATDAPDNFLIVHNVVCLLAVFICCGIIENKDKVYVEDIDTESETNSEINEDFVNTDFYKLLVDRMHLDIKNVFLEEVNTKYGLNAWTTEGYVEENHEYFLLLGNLENSNVKLGIIPVVRQNDKWINNIPDQPRVEIPNEIVVAFKEKGK